MHLKIFSLLSLILLTTSKVYSQIDKGKEVETDLFNYTPDSNSNEQHLSYDFSSPLQKKGETKTLFGSLEDIAKNFPKYSIIKNKERRSFAIREMDKDILVKKYWYGKDVSVVKLETKLELGRVETNTKRIRIECRDHSYVDGDRVRVYLNEKVIRTNIVLQGGYYTIDINLKEGFNRVDIEALNQGTSGPNTAEFNVFDENGNILATKEWNILTGYIATLIVEKN